MFTIEFLNELRMAELDLVEEDLLPAATLLEFGAGTGAQAKVLTARGFDVVAIDLAQSGYAGSRVYPILEYDGCKIPVPDAAFDLVFSSNVLEHVNNLPATFAQFHRVLRTDGGYGVHVMPSVAWRIWTFATGVPTSALAAVRLLRSVWQPMSGLTRWQSMRFCLKTMLGALLPIGHGTSWEGISELWSFSTRAWTSKFERNGFQVLSVRPIGIFHTGHMVFGPRISVLARKKMSRWLGSAATVYVVRPTRSKNLPFGS